MSQRNPRLLLLIAVSLAAGALGVFVAPHRAPERETTCQTDRDCLDSGVCRLSGATRICLPALAPPPNREMIEVVSLGRRGAAADLVWLQIVQFVGNPRSQASGFAGLAPWLRTVTDLAPDFTLAYVFTGSLLSTSRESADEADLILAAGEEVLKDDWQIALWRGFVAYYGRLEPIEAADHFDRSVALGGPAYLSKRAAALREGSKDCGQMQRNLASLRRELSGNGAQDLLNDKQATNILIGCIKNTLVANMDTFRIDRSRSATSVAELVDAGLIAEPPLAPPGQCWVLDDRDAYLAACSTSAPTP